jgi:patatin-related protein
MSTDDSVDAPTSGQKPAPRAATREVRLGLVVYGGVSLAIYINGVADELFRAVRGRGVYKLLKRLLDSDIVVDIISGTSAGGINGLFLAYALCNGREFSDSAELWREQGSLSKLLRLVDDEVNATSLLDSKNFYLPQLERAFRGMTKVPPAVASQERCSQFDELDVFVTGTNFDGRLSTEVDATGRTIDIKSHRAVFHLKHRARRRFDFAFNPDQPTLEERARVAALARLAALTSCFPAAFEPVKVSPGEEDTFERSVYKELERWGSLEGEGWFIDGGVLDNKPFTHTISAIFNRSASRPVERKLFYIEPDPERFSLSDRPVRRAAPTVVESAVQALLGIPGYQSIASDLEDIAKRNDRLVRLAHATEAVEAELAKLKDEGKASYESIPPSVEALYRRARLSQLSARVIRGLLEGDDAFRRSGLRDREASESVRQDLRRRRDAAARLAKAFRLTEPAETLDLYDVYWRRRRLFHVVYKLFDKTKHLCDTASADEEAPKKVAAVRPVWEQLNAQLSTYEIVQWAMEKRLDKLRMPPADVADAAVAAEQVRRQFGESLDALLAVDEQTAIALKSECCAEQHRSDLSDLLWGRVEKPSAAAQNAAPAAGPNLLQQLDLQTDHLIKTLADDDPTIATAWHDFKWYDAHLFPINYFGDLGEKDQIDVVRVSPLDADRAFSQRSVADKITGETVMHFGAFLKKSWRSNDIMWGRLDGVCRILDALLTREALERAVSNPEVRRLLRADLDDGALAPATLFPSSSATVQKRLMNWLRDLASDDDLARTKALDDQDPELRKNGYDLLLACAQLEILDSDLPTVIQDATEEQLEWNYAKTAKGFKPLGLRIDPALAVVNSAQLSREFVRELREKVPDFENVRDAPLADYFSNQYAVGSESVGNAIPPSVLVELVTSTMMVARNCLMNAFPEHAAKVRSTLLYKALLQWPLATAHTLAVFARRERPFYLAGLAVFFTYALSALVGVAILGTDLKIKDDVSEMRVLLLVILPLLILVGCGYMAWSYAMRHFGRSWWVAFFKAALFVLGVVSLSPIAVAFGAAWKATNDQLRTWLQAAPSYPWLRPFVPDSWLQALADRSGSPLTHAFTNYSLVFLVLIFLIVVPALRGAIQSRAARRTAGFVYDDNIRPVLRKYGEVAKTAGRRLPDRESLRRLLRRS